MTLKNPQGTINAGAPQIFSRLITQRGLSLRGHSQTDDSHVRYNEMREVTLVKNKMN